MKRVIYYTYPNLAAWRKARGLNQRDAAKALGLSQTYYGRLERQEQIASGPRAKNIMAIADVPLDVLVGAA